MKIAIADEQTHIRSALRLLISEKTKHGVVLEIMSANSLLHQLSETPADVLIVEWSFIASDPQVILAAIREKTTVSDIMVMSSNSAVRQVVLDAGADGFFCKSESPESVLKLFDQLNDNTEAMV